MQDREMSFLSFMKEVFFVEVNCGFFDNVINNDYLNQSFRASVMSEKVIN